VPRNLPKFAVCQQSRATHVDPFASYTVFFLLSIGKIRPMFSSYTPVTLTRLWIGAWLPIGLYEIKKTSILPEIRWRSAYSLRSSVWKSRQKGDFAYSQLIGSDHNKSNRESAYYDFQSQCHAVSCQLQLCWIKKADHIHRNSLSHAADISTNWLQETTGINAIAFRIFSHFWLRSRKNSERK